MNTIKLLLASILAIFLSVCCSDNRDRKTDAGEEFDPSRFVNPFVGTKNMGHTFPGATLPFGMVQLSPQTAIQPMFVDGKYNKETYRYCSGYQYEDSTIIGFAHTNFSGTGHSDLGDFLIMPATGTLILEPYDPESGKGFSSIFSHEKEFAVPAYYSVLLENYDILAEMTTTERVGFHRYTFPEADSARIILDLMYNIYDFTDKNVWTFIRVENDSLVTGYRQTTGWARTRKIYFALQFSKPFLSYGHRKYDESIYNGFYRKFDETKNFPEFAGRNIRAYFNFTTEKDEQLKIKFALSPVSAEGALLNLKTELPHWDFDRIKNEGRQKWNSELSKIHVVPMSDNDSKTFYTALYHTMLSPIIYEDVDGSYPGLDQNIHSSGGFVNYTIFSLWDTFRALHPLFNLIERKRNIDMINSMLAHYDRSVHNMLPVWSHYANENWCMTGYHAVSVIADALVKNGNGFDAGRALKACLGTSNVGYYDGLDGYIKYGYVPEDKNPYSVTKTLEYSYDDWCIAEIANICGDINIRNDYFRRAGNFKNVFDSTIGFMRPKLSDGSWKPEFNPLDTHGQGFIEGNAWNYGLFVPHSINELIELNGGKESFSDYLDSLFTMNLDDKYIEKTEDITRDGIIGNYVHGNEPGHHIPYLYNWTDEPWKTQMRIRMIMRAMYGSSEDGLCGNDDAGQMSAWYIFGALGFYPVLPGSDRYALGSPLVIEAEIYLENGKIFRIKTINQSEANVYVSRILLNGSELDRNYLLHSEIMNGGEIIFYMDNSF